MISTSYKENLKLLIAKGDKQKALGELLLLVDKQDNRVKNLIYSLSGDFKEYKHKLAAGIISQESSQLLNNSLRLRLLELIDQIEEADDTTIIPSIDAKAFPEYKEAIKEHQLLKEQLAILREEQKSRLELLQQDHNDKAQQLELVNQEKLALEELVKQAKAKELVEIEAKQQKQEAEAQKLAQTQAAKNALEEKLASLEQQTSKAQIEQEQILQAEQQKLAAVLKEKEDLQLKIAAVERLSEQKELEHKSKEEQLRQFENIRREKITLAQQFELAKQLEVRTTERLRLEQENKQLLIEQERKEKKRLKERIEQIQKISTEEDRKNKLLNAEIQSQLDLVHQEKEKLEIQLYKAKEQESKTIQQLEFGQRRREKELEKERREKATLQKKLEQLRQAQSERLPKTNGHRVEPTAAVAPIPKVDEKSNWAKYIGISVAMAALFFSSLFFLKNSDTFTAENWVGTWEHTMHLQGNENKPKTGTVQFLLKDAILSGKVTTFYKGGNVELQLKNIELSNNGYKLTGIWESDVFHQEKPKTGLFEFNYATNKKEFIGNSTITYPVEERDKTMLWKGVKR